MNKTILSVLIANAMFTSSVMAAIPPSDTGSTDTNEHDFFSTVVDGTGGNIGGLVSQEDKKSYDASGNLIGKNEYTEISIISGFLYNKHLPVSLNYSLEKTRNKWSPAGNSSPVVDNGYKLSTNLRYNRGIGGGFSSGFGWANETDRNDRTQKDDKQVSHKGKVKQDINELYTFLGYWNNDWQGGFYNQFNYGMSKETNSLDSTSNWGILNDTYYEISIKPYKNFGKFFGGIEFYYEDKDTDGRDGTYLQNYNEWYIEPELAYTFDFGGRLSIKQRYGVETTKMAATKVSKEANYFGEINKTTIGYQQNFKNWSVNTEVELFKEDKEQETVNNSYQRESNGWDETKKIKITAEYRF
ncbi:hypothetical protein L4C34_02580 [Vibrio profundum]|uniref:hypothetical protein n=1 Tax=Vibrio profundum TaxID=2910247 RepID=UPI003D10C081